MERTWRGIPLFAATSLALMCAGCAGGTSEVNGAAGASCAGPYLNDQPPGGPFRGPVPTASPGTTITIYGHWYTSTCNDTGGRRDPLKPLPPVHLTLALPGAEAQPLGEVHPRGKDVGFSIVVHVPAGTRSGTATVRDDRRYPATFTFVVGP